MKDSERSIGIVVLNWNGRAVLERCLDSVERALLYSRHRAELLLVDNDSGDGSDLWAEQNYPRWTLLRTGSNLRYLAPRLGATSMLAWILAGQMLASLVLDHFGWLGFPVHPINWGRIVGVLMLVGGILLIRNS